MKNRVFKKVFTDKNRLNSMFEFRKKGYSYLSLAIIYGVDHSSIYSQCKKYGVGKPQDHHLEFNIPYIISSLNVSIRRSKSYADYLLEDMERNKKLRLSQLTSNK